MYRFLEHSNIVDVIRGHAHVTPHQDAVILVPDPARPAGAQTLTYCQLDNEARRIAAWLQEHADPDDRILLLYAPGLNFATAFVACLYAGMIAVPAPLPGQHSHQQRRIARIASDAGVAALLTDSANLEAVRAWTRDQQVGAIACLASDDAAAGALATWRMPEVGRATLALLQYTSGSTGAPKGVMISHDNLLHNADSLCRAYGLGPQTRFGGWIPLFHDMGLMGLLLPALFLGSTCILTTPHTFLKRPHLWLRMIADFHIAFTAAPNFAYDLCLQRIDDAQVSGLDLSHWRFAANGSELVQARTIGAFVARFAPLGLRADVICPCYGMAETTLFVSGSGARVAPVCTVDAGLLERHRFVPDAQGARSVVSCGVVHDLDVLIVDPDTREVAGPGVVGEIWLRGASVAQGYWRHPKASARDFDACTVDGRCGYFRTGDLGVLHGGELYVIGRHKEMMVVHGRNLYPQDIERAVRDEHAELASGAGAVFTVTAPDEEVVVTHELRGQWCESVLPALARGIKATVMASAGVRVAAVVLLRPGGVLRTTSGKIQRGTMRTAFLQCALSPMYEDVDTHLQALRQAAPASESAR